MRKYLLKTYFFIIKKITLVLKWSGLSFLSCAFGTFFAEPLSATKATWLYLRGKIGKFVYHGLNPSIISEQQSKKRAILLLHGNYHNQSAWLDLAEKLQKTTLGPVYTVNLKSGPHTRKDLKTINKKVLEIKNQYSKHGKNVIIDIVGHSRGAELALATVIEENPEFFIKNGKFDLNNPSPKPFIGIIIRIGSPLTGDLKNKLPQTILSRIYEIDGTLDLIIDDRSESNGDHQLNIDCGHLGLLYHPKMHDKVIKWLSSDECPASVI